MSGLDGSEPAALGLHDGRPRRRSWSPWPPLLIAVGLAVLIAGGVFVVRRVAPHQQHEMLSRGQHRPALRGPEEQWGGGGRPGPSNTGTSGALTPYTGPTAVAIDGTTIENKTIVALDIQADNVTIRNCRIGGTGKDYAGDPLYGLRMNSGKTGILIENCEVRNCKVGFIGGGFTMRRCYVHAIWEDGGSVTSGYVIEENYATALGRLFAKAHADFIHQRAGGNGIIRHNVIDTFNDDAHEANSAIFIQADNGNCSNITIHHNEMRSTGSNITLYVEERNGFRLTNVVIADNLIGRGKGGSYVHVGGRPSYTQSGNVDADTLEPISF